MAKKMRNAINQANKGEAWSVIGEELQVSERLLASITNDQTPKHVR
jgi:hypothetical protein